MKKEDFTFENKEYYIENAYVFDYPKYIIIINKDIFDEETIDYANEIVEKYKKEKELIIEYMLNDRLREFYKKRYNYSDEFIKNNIGRPQIRILSRKDNFHPNWKFKYLGVIDFCESKLDEHIISIEFIDDLKLYGDVELDG